MIDKEYRIECKRLILRRLNLRDSADINIQINDPEVVRWTTRIPYPYPPGAAEAFIRQSQRLWLKGSSFTFGIILRQTDRLIGIISLSNVFPKHACAELGFWLGKDFWNQGYMTEASISMVRFGLEKLSLFRIYASTFEANAASRKILERCGFQLEGTMRLAVVREGKRQNFLNYGLLRPEFTDLHEKI